MENAILVQPFIIQVRKHQRREVFAQDDTLGIRVQIWAQIIHQVEAPLFHPASFPFNLFYLNKGFEGLHLKYIFVTLADTCALKSILSYSHGRVIFIWAHSHLGKGHISQPSYYQAYPVTNETGCDQSDENENKRPDIGVTSLKGKSMFSLFLPLLNAS